MVNKTFKKFYKKNFTSLRHAGDSLGISYQSVNKYLRGHYVPKIRIMELIARKTKGAVPMTTWGSQK